jgi:hypothetical protein
MDYCEHNQGMGPGRESATVRQALLVLELMAASFRGGTFVNGPGLRWVQTQLLGLLGSSEGVEIAAVDLKAAAGLERVRDAPRADRSRTVARAAGSCVGPGHGSHEQHGGCIRSTLEAPTWVRRLGSGRIAGSVHDIVVALARPAGRRC